MEDNSYSKEDILQCLSSKGYFIDSFTLNTFLSKWQIEPISRNEEGKEFYGKDTLDIILKNLFNTENTEQGADMTENFNNENNTFENNNTVENNPVGNNDYFANAQVENNQAETSQTEIKPDIIPNVPNDDEAMELLQGISLSDGSKLVDKIEISSLEEITQKGNETVEIKRKEEEEKKAEENKRPGLLAATMESMGKDFDEAPTVDTEAPSISANKAIDDDDLSALSNSFKELEMKEFEMNNAKELENKLSLSTQINTITKVVSKKIAKYVSAICLQEAKSTIRLSQAQEDIFKLNQKLRSLEEQNKKLRLLLTESNRNLNSYKPAMFGLYKKVKPGK